MSKRKNSHRVRTRRANRSIPRRRRLSGRWFSRLIMGLIAVVAAAALYLAIPHLIPALASIRDSFIRFFGLSFIFLLIDLAIIAWLAWRKRLLHSLRFWNKWLGGLVITLAAFGVTALLRSQDIVIGNVSLEDASLGGTVGTTIIGARDWGELWRPVALMFLGAVLIAPRQTFPFLLARGRQLRRAYQRRPLHRSGLVAVRRAASAIRITLERRRRLAPEAEQKRQIAAGEAVAQPSPRQLSLPETHPPQPEMEARETQEAIAEPTGQMRETMEKLPFAPLPVGPWQLPPIDLLDRTPDVQFTQADINERARIIEEALASYGVEAKVTQVNSGPAVTQFGVEPGWHRKYKEVRERDQDGRIKLDRDGRPKVILEEVARTRVKVENITSLANDLALALAAPSVRIEAPVPGKPLVGIEVPNTITSTVALRSIIESVAFQRLSARSKLTLALGKGVGGEATVADLTKMPHLLIAGATGSGKSVCLNCIISCLLLNTTPDEVRMLMVDPKRVELAPFNSVPHLIAPVVIEVEEIVKMLRRVTQEMDYRYRRFAAAGARNIEAYNKVRQDPLPYLIVIIDELADVMITAPYEVERTVCRLAQLARATGIHLIIATQRPSVDVITGLIKANFPTRISFAVTSQVDSRTILDMGGAEKLLGRGDMLYLPTDAAKPKRVQGAFVSDQEIERLVDHWTSGHWQYPRASPFADGVAQAFSALDDSDAFAVDPLLERAKSVAAEHSRISTSLLQRRLHIGYPRAARLMDALEAAGLVGSSDGGRSRQVLTGEDDEHDSE